MLTVKFETKRDGRVIFKQVMECAGVRSHVNEAGATLVDVDLPNGETISRGDGPAEPSSQVTFFYVMNESGQTVDGGCMTSTRPQVVQGENEGSAA